MPRGRPKSKSKKASRKPSRSKSRGKQKVPKKRQTKQGKIMEAIFEQSPYNIFDVKGSNMSLFGEEYKTMKPMSYYRSNDYPFYPGSNESGLLSGLNKPLKRATSEDPYLDRLLDLNRKTMDLVEGSTAGKPSDPLKVIDTRHKAYLSSNALGGGPEFGEYSNILAGLLRGSTPGSSSYNIPFGPSRNRRNIRTLDELTYTIKQTPENKGVIDNSYYLGVKDTDGVDPNKDFLFVSK